MAMMGQVREAPVRLDARPLQDFIRARALVAEGDKVPGGQGARVQHRGLRELARRMAPRVGLSVNSANRMLQRVLAAQTVTLRTADIILTAFLSHVGLVYGWSVYEGKEETC